MGPQPVLYDADPQPTHPSCRPAGPHPRARAYSGELVLFFGALGFAGAFFFAGALAFAFVAVLAFAGAFALVAVLAFAGAFALAPYLDIDFDADSDVPAATFSGHSGSMQIVHGPLRVVIVIFGAQQASHFRSGTTISPDCGNG